MPDYFAGVYFVGESTGEHIKLEHLFVSEQPWYFTVVGLAGTSPFTFISTFMSV